METKVESIDAVLFNDAARTPILQGVKTVHDAVSCTLGPRGRNVIIERRGQLPLVTKDGVTVARAVRLRDRAHALGAELMKEASSQTNDEAGDGTTTAIVLTHALCQGAAAFIDAGHSPSELKKEMETAVEAVIERLNTLAIPVQEGDVKHVATISANGDEYVGGLVAEAMEKVGHEGVITLEEAKGTKTSLEIIDGLRLSRGYLSPFFVTDERRMACVLENPYILLTDSALSSLRDILPLLEMVNKQSRPILIIADDITGEAMQGLVLNTVKGNLKACAIRAPSFGIDRAEMLHDLAALTGGEPVLKDTGVQLKNITADALGQCRRVIVDRNSTVLVCEDADKRVNDRIASVREELKNPTIEASERGRIEARLANLQKGAAIIRVGGATEIEMRERKDRIEDALNSTRSAVEEGTVPGGGTALYLALRGLAAELNTAGAQIVQTACLAPMETILRNADIDPVPVIKSLKSSISKMGYDASQERLCDMYEVGIIDPVKVTRCALKNALSVAIMYVTLGCAVFDTDDPLSALQLA